MAVSRTSRTSLIAPTSSQVTSGTVAKPSLSAEGCTFLIAFCTSVQGHHENTTTVNKQTKNSQKLNLECTTCLYILVSSFSMFFDHIIQLFLSETISMFAVDINEIN